MKHLKSFCSILLIAGVFISEAALADPGRGGHSGHGYTGHAYAGRGYSGHGHVGIGLYFGGPYVYPYYPPYYYPYPYYYYPPAIITPVPEQPPVYIEQQGQISSPNSPETADQNLPDNYYWYHCDKPEGYYPYIKDCPGGWQKVTPTPPPQP